MAAWTPAQLASLELWLDASASGAIETNGGGGVTSWADLSGNDRHATLYSGATENPTLTSLNGLTAVSSGPGQAMTASAAGLSGSFPRTFLGVFAADAGTSSTRSFFTQGTSPSVNGSRWAVREDTGKLRVEITGAGHTSAIDVTSGGLIGATHTGTNFAGLEMLRDGTAYSGLTANTNTLNTDATELLIGRYHVTASTTRGGVVGELVYCSELLSLGDRQKLEGYLAHKWDFAGRLPSDHPYKTAPPEEPGTDPVLEADGASLTLQGQAAGLRSGRRVPGDSAGLARAGQPAQLVADRRLSCEADLLARSGQDAALSVEAERALDASGATLELAGPGAGLRAARHLAAAGAALALSGQDAAFGIAVDYRLAAEGSQLAPGGQPAGLAAARRLPAEGGALGLGVSAVELRKGAGATFEGSVVSLAGHAAELRARRALSAAAGSVLLSGGVATFVRTSEVPASVAAAGIWRTRTIEGLWRRA